MAYIIPIYTGGGGGGGSTPHNSLPGLQGLGPEYYHLTAAEYSSLFGGVNDKNKYGSVAIGAASSIITVNFSVPFTGAADYNLSFNFMNDIDPSPNVLTGLVTQRTVSQFTIRIAGEVDTGNYVMFWHAYR